MQNNSYISTQYKILDIWNKDRLISPLIKSAEEIIFHPDSEEIYKKYKGVEEFYRNYGTFNEEKAIEIIHSIFNNEDAIYILYNLVNEEINQYSISDNFYPVFKVKFNHIKEWLKLISLNNFVGFYIFSLESDKFLEISLLDDEKGCLHYHFQRSKL